MVLGERKTATSLSKRGVNGMQEDEQFLLERATEKLMSSVGSQVSTKPEFGKIRKCGTEFNGLQESMMTQLFQKLGRREEVLFDQKRSYREYLSDGSIGECK